MKANELIEDIHAGQIKENTTIRMHDNGECYDLVYINGGIKYKDTTTLLGNNFLCSPFVDFEVIEDDTYKINKLNMKIKQLEKEIERLKRED